MSEQQTERNPFAEIFVMASQHSGPLVFVDPAHQDQLAEVVHSVFSETVEAMPEEITDESAADAWITEHVLGLLDTAFKAGMIYYANFVEPPPPAPMPSQVGTTNDNVISLTSADALQIVTGLLGKGVLIRVGRLTDD
jgi:uncharacterized lipoprotein YajG